MSARFAGAGMPGTPIGGAVRKGTTHSGGTTQ